MGERVNLQSRRQLLKQFAPQYRQASSVQKRVLLDTFAQDTGSHRGSGMWLLNHAHVQACEPRRVQKSNTRCSWSGTPPIASSPNASSLFSPHSFKHWSDMRIFT